MVKYAQDTNNFFGPMPSGEVAIFVDKDGDGKIGEDEVISFELPEVPGAPDAQEIVVEQKPTVSIDKDGNEDSEHNPWDWVSKGVTGFIPWLKGMMENVPRHTGYDTTGLEKAIAYFEALDKEITRAMRQDYKNEINSADAENAREQIEKGLERLVDRLEKVRATKYKRHAKKSKSWYNDFGIVKEAQKAAHVGSIVITVPLLISRAARVCINGVVSAGHDLEDMFDGQVKEYSLDKREQAELAQLLADMGYALRGDRGYAVGTPVDETRSDNRDWSAAYVS